MNISKMAVGKVAAGLALLFAVFQSGLAFAALAAKESQPSAEQIRVSEAYGKLPMSFEANVGQTASDVKFLSRGDGYQLYLTPTAAVMTLSGGGAEGAERNVKPALSVSKDPVGARFNAPAPQQAVVKMKFLGAAARPKLSGESVLPGKVNYFVGKDKSKWRANVPTYGRVRYASVYPGVDLVYYGNQRQLEYDFVVAPGADPKTIRLAFEGTDKLEIDADGALVLNTAVGRIVQQKPVIYQEVAGERKEISGRYRLKGRREVGFEVARYDTTQPLVIDPVLVYSTYLGGSEVFVGCGIGGYDLDCGGDDFGHGIAVDGSSSAYVTGQTSSLNFPTEMPLQGENGGGDSDLFTDVFVAKLNLAGSGLIYATYLGGSAHDSGFGIAVDGSGSAYVTGYTGSTDFPTEMPFQGTNGGGYDAFVAKLNLAGSGLLYATYLGGSGGDYGEGIAVDGSDSAYVTGYTGSIDFPTEMPFQGANGGGYDAFVAKLNLAGSGLLYATYLGGSESDYGEGIAVDGSGSAYVTGRTGSIDFQTEMPFQGANGGGYDAFVAKLDLAGSGLLYATYLGGSEYDYGYGIAVDGSGSAYVTGWTTSTDFPTEMPFQGANGGGYDVFVAKLDLAGSGLLYATYLGGSNNDIGYGIAVDGSGSAYVTGYTGSTDFPTETPLQGANGGDDDVFVAKLDVAGSNLVYATYLGSSGSDGGHGIAVDGSGSAYVTGWTDSTDFPTTATPLQEANGGGYDVFVAKIGPSCNGLPATIVGTSDDDIIMGTSGPDVIVGLGGNDGIHGGGGDDTICGDEGNDQLYGKKGNDWIEGGDGNDRIHGGSGDDTLVGETGLDTCQGSSGIDTADASCETITGVP